MHARLCSDLAYNCNNQSSCVLVGEMALLCGTTPCHAMLLKTSLCNHDTSVDIRTTNFILATRHAQVVCILCDLILHWQ